MAYISLPDFHAQSAMSKIIINTDLSLHLKQVHPPLSKFTPIKAIFDSVIKVQTFPHISNTINLLPQLEIYRKHPL